MSSTSIFCPKITSDLSLFSPLQGYSTLPGYGNSKEAVRPITIWKGNSYTTISARDPAFSGKDSGKGDSDFNDSDSDVSGDTGLKKDGVVVPPMAGQNGERRGEKKNINCVWMWVSCSDLKLTASLLLLLFQLCGLAPVSVKSWATQIDAGAPQQ